MSTGFRQMASLTSGQECSPAEDLHPSQDEVHIEQVE